MYLLLLLVIAVLSPLISASTFTNPIREHAADPSMFYDVSEGYYYLLHTGSPIELVRARTLEGLKTGETKKIWSDDTPSRCCSLWAPELHKLDGTWYLYYTAGPKSGDQHYPHVLKGGRSPWDTYTYLGQLSPEWGIDGSTIHFPQLGNYFLWSCQRSSELTHTMPNHQAICIAPLLTPSTLGPHSSVISAPTQPWERHGFPVNEGPHALYHGNKTYISYSGSSCATKEYSLGLLTWTGGDPMAAGSWVKSGPVLRSGGGNLGTGHNGFFRSPDGTEIWNVFHAENQFPDGNCGPARYTMAERVYFDEDTGRPAFEQAKELGTRQMVPSGEGEEGGLATPHESAQN